MQMSRETIRQLFAVAAFALAAGTMQAQTPRYWGGGTTTITDGTQLTPAAGNWATAGIENWGDQDGVPVPENATFNPWTAGDIACFGARTTGYTVTPQAGGVTVGGLTTYLYDGTGAGTITITPNAAFTINAGAQLNILAGTTVSITSGTAPVLTTSGFTLTGGGTFNITTYSGTFVSSGTLTVSNGILASGNTLYQSPFGNMTLNLVAPNGRMAQGRQNELGATPWPSITGTGTVRPTTAAAGFYSLSLNNSANVDLDVLVLDGATAGVLTLLYKANTGILTVKNPANSYFGNIVRQGTLSPGVANALKGWVLADGDNTRTGIFATSDSSYFTGPITAVSGGQINGANVALAQMQLMSGGAVLYNGLGEIPGTGRVLNGAQKGAVIVGAYAFDDTLLQRIDESFEGVIALGASIGAGTTLHFDGAGGNFAKARLGAWGASRTFDGTLVPNGGVYRLGGGNAALTITTALTGTGSLDVNNGPNKAYFGQGALPACSVWLSANNTLVGPVTVGNGVTLTLSTANGRLSGATGVTITDGGILTMADASGSNGDRIPSVEMKLLKTGTFNYIGNSASPESLGDLTIDGGYSTITSARNTGGATAYAEFAQANPVNWGTVNFTIGANSAIRFGIDPAAGGTMIGPWALVGSTFAVYQTAPSESVIAMPAGSQTTVASDANWTGCGPASHVSLTTAFTASAGKTVNSVRNAAAATQVYTWTGVNKVESGGIAVQNSGNPATTFSGGQWTSGASDHGLYLYSLDANRTFTFNSEIVNDGATPVTLVKGGPGPMTVSSSASSFSGGVVINAGTLTMTHQNALGAGSSLVFNGRNTTLDPSSGTDARTFNQAITVNADGTLRGVTGTGGTTTINGDITFNNDCLFTLGQFDLSRAMTVNGRVTGAGSLRLRANSGTTITLQGAVANDYTGDTFVAAVVVLNKTNPANAIPGNVFIGTVESSNGNNQRPTVRWSRDNQIADAAVLTFGGGFGGVNTTVLSPSLQLTSKSDTVGGLNSLTGNGIVENGTAATISTLTLGGSGSYAFGGLIRDGAAGTLALTKTGAGTQALSYANTYTGDTAVNGGTLLVRNASGSGTGAGNVTVGASGTLGGDGQVAPGAAKSIAVSGTVAPGASVGTLTVDLGGTALGVTLASGAKLACELAAPGTGDKLRFLNYAGAGDLTLNNNVIDVTDAGGMAEGQYTIMEFYSDSGSTLTDTGKPLSGLVVGTGFGTFTASSIDYSQLGKIVLNVTKPKGTLITVK